MPTVKAITGLSDEQIDEVLRWFSRQPRKVQLRCINPDQLAKLIKHTAQVKEVAQVDRGRDSGRNLDRFKDTEDVRLEQLRSNRRKSPKASALWQRRALIKRLLKKHENLSLVADYLKKYERISVTPSYLRRLWLKWLENGLV